MKNFDLSFFSDIKNKLNSDFWNDILIYAFIVAVSILLYYLLRYVVVKVVKKIVTNSKTQWDDILYENKFFHICCLLVPLLIIYHFTDVILANHKTVYGIVNLILQLFFVFNILMIIRSLLKSVEARYSKNNKKTSIKGLIQAVMMLLNIITVIIVFSILLGKEVSSILTGLGAASAILMLIFKDSIIGFVSGIQLATNDMVRLGDWIEIPASGVDGEVIDIAMISVKVQNWDNTIVSVPAYDLISKSFKNWRGMSEKGIRRIKRSVIIDMNSIKYCTPEMLERFRNYEYMDDYITKTQKDIEEFNAKHEKNTSLIINGRQQSNIGVFRMYVLRYLQNNPKVSKKGTLMVRQLQSTENGIPIEVYVFTNTSAWLSYEDIQSDIFDHIIAAVPYFDLRIYQRSSDNPSK